MVAYKQMVHVVLGQSQVMTNPLYTPRLSIFFSSFTGLEVCDGLIAVLNSPFAGFSLLFRNGLRFPKIVNVCSLVLNLLMMDVASAPRKRLRCQW